MISAPGTLPEHPYFNCKYNDYFIISNRNFFIPPQYADSNR